MVESDAQIIYGGVLVLFSASAAAAGWINGRRHPPEPNGNHRAQKAVAEALAAREETVFQTEVRGVLGDVKETFGQLLGQLQAHAATMKDVAGGVEVIIAEVRDGHVALASSLKEVASGAELQAVALEVRELAGRIQLPPDVVLVPRKVRRPKERRQP